MALKYLTASVLSKSQLRSKAKGQAPRAPSLPSDHTGDLFVCLYKSTGRLLHLSSG